MVVLLRLSPRRGSVPALLARWLGWGVSALLLVRGIGIEVLLLTDATHPDTSVSEEQRTWTLALWNPWFVVGGLAFGLAALRSRRHTCVLPRPTAAGSTAAARTTHPQVSNRRHRGCRCCAGCE
ncbi:DUF3995 domain-containing protein [Streptomyces sp. SID2955]|nr:DUF3995 domain-containing protein [Streptomyces sp. SID2955]